VSVNQVTLQTHLEKIIELKFDAIEKAILLAAANAEDRQEERASELSRRLEILNHAHQQAVEVQATYVPRELHEAAIDKIKDRIESLERTAAIAAALAVVAQILFNWWSRQP